MGVLMRDTVFRFSKTTVVLHWLIGVSVIAMLGFGLYLGSLPRGADKLQLLGIHKSLGVVLLVLVLLRICWRVINGMPKNISHAGRFVRGLAYTVHVLLLLGTVLMPASGVLMSLGSGTGLAVFGLEIVPFARNTPGFVPNETMIKLGGATHFWGARLLIVAIALHAAGALKHHFWDRDNTLRRMLGFSTQ
ncbi:MAG: cytochrome b [Rhodobacteraceae bacterium]|nr:cytochrome b [Paracoccaceae bacterium]